MTKLSFLNAHDARCRILYSSVDLFYLRYTFLLYWFRSRARLHFQTPTSLHRKNNVFTRIRYILIYFFSTINYVLLPTKGIRLLE